MGRQRAAAADQQGNSRVRGPPGARATQRGQHKHTNTHTHTHTHHTFSHTAHTAGRREEGARPGGVPRVANAVPHLLRAAECLGAQMFSKLHTPFETSATQLGAELESISATLRGTPPGRTAKTKDFHRAL